MRPTILTALSVLMGCSYVTRAIACGSVEVISGSTCETLVLDFKLKDCGVTDPSKPTFKCDKDVAIATVKAHGTKFRARIRAVSNGTGTLWVPGSIEKIEKAEKPAPKPVAKTVAEPVREIARVPGPLDFVKATPTPIEPSRESPLEFRGLVDGYISQRLSGGSSSRTGYRAYDVYTGQFVLNLVEVGVRKRGGEVGLALDLDFGEQSELSASDFVPSPGGTQTGPADDVTKHLGQAFISYRPNEGHVLFEMGKMVTHAGYEAPQNNETINYSKSNLNAFGMPLYNTGVHVGFDVIPARYSIGLYAYNSWSARLSGPSSRAVGAQIKLTPTDKFTFTYNLLRDSDRILNEGLFQFEASSNLTLVLDAVAGNYFHASWWGVAGYAKYRFSPIYYLGLRAENVADSNGALFAGTLDKSRTFTVTNGFSLDHRLEFRLEGRYDQGSQDFASQTTVTGAVMLGF